VTRLISTFPINKTCSLSTKTFTTLLNEIYSPVNFKLNLQYFSSK
jgi:hypothetical protein